MKQSVYELLQEYDLLFESRKWDDIIALLQRCSDIESFNKDIHFRLVKVFAIRGRIRDIIHECIRIIDIHMTHERYEPVREIASFLMTLAPRNEKALERVTEFYERGDYTEDFCRAAFVLARLYIKNNKNLMVQYVLQKVLDSTSEINTRIEAARIFSKARMPSRALAIYKELLLHALMNKNRSRMDKILAEVRHAGGSQIAVHSILGETFWQLDDLNSAAAQYTEILKIDKANGKALKSLGCILYAQERYELAIKAFMRILAANPADVDASTGIAQAYAKSGQIQKALEYFESTSKIYMGNRKYNEAYKIYKRILELDPDNLSARKESLRLKPGKAPAKGPEEESAAAVSDKAPPPQGAAKRTPPRGGGLFRKRSAVSGKADAGTPRQRDDAPVAEGEILFPAGSEIPEEPDADEAVMSIDMPDSSCDAFTEEETAGTGKSVFTDDDYESLIPDFEDLIDSVPDEADEQETQQLLLPEDFLAEATSSPRKPSTAIFEELLPEDFFLDMILGEAENEEKLPEDAKEHLENLRRSIESIDREPSMGIVTLGGEILWNPHQSEVEVFSTLCSLIKKMDGLHHRSMRRMLVLEWKEKKLVIASFSREAHLFVMVKAKDQAAVIVEKEISRVRELLCRLFQAES